MITLVLILAISLMLVGVALKLRSQVKQQGVVLDFWNRFSTTIMGLGTIVLVSIFQLTTPEQWTDLFGQAGGTVKLIDALVVAATMLYATIKQLFNKAPAGV